MLFSVLGIQNLLDLELFLVLDPEFYISKMKEQMNKYNLYSYFLTQRKAVMYFSEALLSLYICLFQTVSHK